VVALVFKELPVAQEIHQAPLQAKEMLEEEDRIPLHFRVVVAGARVLLAQRGLYQLLALVGLDQHHQFPVQALLMLEAGALELEAAEQVDWVEQAAEVTVH
jgi:hypothetical protein